MQNTPQQKLHSGFQQILQNLKYKALKHEINYHKSIKILSPTGVAIICVEKLHWQMVAINTAISGGKQVPTYHVIW